jgi:hypothetical protein
LQPATNQAPALSGVFLYSRECLHVLSNSQRECQKYKNSHDILLTYRGDPLPPGPPRIYVPYKYTRQLERLGTLTMRRKFFETF